MKAYILNTISLLGGLALFLFGMDIMGKSLERQAGGKLQAILAKMSATIPKGFLLGLAATAAIQSSSATTVMVVGFVNSGIMTLKQAVGVIMGSNVGTTATAWLLSLSGLQGDSLLIDLLKPTTLAPLLGTVGIFLFMFTKSDRKRGIGTILLGFLVLMTGLRLMSDSMAFLKSEAWFSDLMLSFSNPLLGILAGAVLTAMIQSSSASIGILQGLCVTGAVTYGAAIPIVLGQNIGTCVTTLLGAVGANRNARRTATVHLLFNVLGVLLFAIVFYSVNLFFPFTFLRQTAQVWDIAIIHTFFNLSATAVLLPANALLVKLAYLFIPENTTSEKPVLLDERLLATPAAAIRRAHQIAGVMAQTSAEAMTLGIRLIKAFDPSVLQKIIAFEKETDRYQDALGTYLVKLSGANLSVEDNRMLNILLYTISDLERIGDHAVSIANAGAEIAQKRTVFSDQAQQELAVLGQAVLDVIQRTVSAYTDLDLTLAAKVEPQEQVVDSLVREIKSRHVRRLRDGLCSAESGWILDDLLTAFERSADHCSNIAVEMLQVAEGKLEAHEYLNALKSGELQESAKYAERFARYKAKYSFPDEI